MSQRSDVAQRFEDEVFFGLQRRAALFGWFAGLSLAVALCAVGAMVFMLPLKEIRPYVVMVDRETGESELVVSTRPADLAETDAVRQAELVRYVSERGPTTPPTTASASPRSSPPRKGGRRPRSARSGPGSRPVPAGDLRRGTA